MGQQWACEAVLWTTWTHYGNLCAMSECRLLALDAKEFRKIVSLFPTRHACRYASGFCEQLNCVDRSSLSDIWTPDFDKLMEIAIPEWDRGGHHHEIGPWDLGFSLTSGHASPKHRSPVC